jgi:hypothetical protein
MSGREAPTRGRTSSPAPTDPEVIDRLARLRSILPLMATDLAAARRRPHTLELDNRRLTRRVAELESRLLYAGGQARSVSDGNLSQPEPVQLSLPRS